MTLSEIRQCDDLKKLRIELAEMIDGLPDDFEWTPYANEYYECKALRERVGQLEQREINRLKNEERI